MLKQEVCKVKYNIPVRNRFNILCIEETEQYSKELENSKEQIDRKWKDFRDCLQTAGNEVLLMKSKRNKNKWMAEDILHGTKKEVQNDSHIEYQRLNKEIANDCREDKEQWLTDQCQEIEKLEKQHKTKEIHQKITNFSNKKNRKKQASGIMSKDGKLHFEQVDISKRWVEYISNLYNDSRDDMPTFPNTSGENILKEEVQGVIKSMKDGEAVGTDKISTEMLRALDEENLDSLTKLCNIIYDRGHIPTEMEQSIFVTMPKKANAQNCTDFRTISLISHVTKLLLKAIRQIVISKIDKEVSRLQNGFRPGLGTRESIFNLRAVIERLLETQNDVYICLIEYTKALKLESMYWEQTAVVKTEEFKIKKGVRQGCVLSASLFNLYTEKIFREIDNANGVVIGGTNINNNRYADDTALMATTAVDLQELTTKIHEKGKTYGMEINVKKTKKIVVSKKNPVPDANILKDETPIEQVTSKVYLGHMVTDDGKSDKEIKRRIEIARNVYKNLSTILSSRDTSINTRKHIVKCYVLATFLSAVTARANGHYGQCLSPPKDISKEKTVQLSYNSEKNVKMLYHGMFHQAFRNARFDYCSFCSLAPRT